MYQQQVNLINTIKMLFDALSIITGAYCAYYIIINFYPWMWSLNAAEFITSILLVMFVNNYIMGRFGLYSDRKYESYQQLLRALTKTVIIDFIILGSGMLIYKQMYSARLFYTCFLIISYIILVSERTVLRFFYEMNHKNRLNLRRILLVGDLERSRLIAEALQKQLSWGHEIVGTLTDKREELSSPRTIGYIDDLQDILRTQAIDEVIFALGSRSSIELQSYLKTCRSMGITTRILPALWTHANTNLRAENYQGIPFLTFYENNYSASGLFYKRILDIVGGIVGTVIFFILYPFIALAIKIDRKSVV
jgi:FlaA1/EpsC-like NDP-sugar epimerase